jgi:hypothetical protein
MFDEVTIFVNAYATGERKKNASVFLDVKACL